MTHARLPFGRPGRAWRRLARAALILLSPLACFILLDLLFPLPLARLSRSPAVVVADRAGDPLRFFLPADQIYRFPVKLDDVSPELMRSVIALEDRWFYMHPGINPLSVARAVASNLRAGRVVSGASTLTMQVARMSDPAPRTLLSKCREAFRALQLEWHFDKDELLEIYLNIAPYGGNIEGVGAAGWFWFGKTPDRLSVGEAALLAVLPRSPAAFDPALHPDAAKAARDGALDRLAAMGIVPSERAAAAKLQPLPAARRRPPFVAPHFSQLVRDAFARRARVVTTLDRRMQAAAEQQVAARIEGLRRRGVGNAAVVVIEQDASSARAVRVMVGSAGFGQTEFAGQVNGALARRSPGSALKPFLYARAFDTGRLVPDSFLLDVPTDFSGYVAENYDGQYRGKVTAREALVQSLNAPAVRLLSDVGVEEFVGMLRRGGLSTLDRPPREYGLPLILGSGEVSLLGLTNLYATLARGGRHAAWTILAAGAGPPEVSAEGDAPRDPGGGALMSPESARWVTTILSELKRPDMPSAWDLTRDAPAVAWKTGTSYGHRDAWAIGYSARLTIGVWVGNPDGRAVKGISGAEDAGPLLFDLFRALDAGATRLPEPPGLQIETIQVCPLSHALAGPFCPGRETIRYLPGRSRLGACALHRRVFVEDATGLAVAGDCLAARPHHAVVVEVDPPELAAWLQSQGRPVKSQPAASPECGVVPADDAPRIVSPSAATPYRLRRDAPEGHQQIPLIASVAPGSGEVFWYQDGVLAAQGPAGSGLFLAPTRGRHRLVLVDSEGRSDSITYTIE